MPIETATQSPDTARRRTVRPSPAMAADMTRWAVEALNEPLWGGTATGEPTRRRRGPGRPSRLNPEVVGRFLQAIRAGNHRETAAQFAGISNATLYRWLRDSRAPFVAFRRAVVMAEAEVEVEVVSNIIRLSSKSTRAAAFWLSRRYPGRWPMARPERSRRPLGR